MGKKQREIASIIIHEDKPTDLAFSDLYTWVIWQFPRLVAAGFFGAVRPPIANHGWFPALIMSRNKRVQVYGHLNKTFASPDEAASWLEAHNP